MTTSKRGAGSRRGRQRDDARKWYVEVWPDGASKPQLRSGPFTEGKARVIARERQRNIDDRGWRMAVRVVQGKPGYAIRDVTRYDLSPAGKAWIRVYREQGATSETRASFERLSRFDQAAIRYLLTDNGRS